MNSKPDVTATQAARELRAGAVMFGGLAEIIGCLTAGLIVVWMLNSTITFSKELGGWCGTTMGSVLLQMWFCAPLALAVPMICAVVCGWCGTRRVLARRALVTAAGVWFACCAGTLGWAWLQSLSM